MYSHDSITNTLYNTNQIAMKLCVPSEYIKAEAGIRTHVFDAEEYKEYPNQEKGQV